MRAIRPTAGEDAPVIAIQRPTIGEVPADPGAVEFDFDPEEIPFEAMEFLEPPRDDFEDDPDTDAIAMEELGEDAVEALDVSDETPEVTDEAVDAFDAPTPLAASRSRSTRSQSTALGQATAPR